MLWELKFSGGHLRPLPQLSYEYLCFPSARYSSHLGDAQTYGIKKGVMSGLGMGFFQLIMFGSYALAFW